MSNLDEYLEKPVSDLIRLPALSLSEEEKERHTIYSCMLFAIAANYFSFTKYGREHEYPLSPQEHELDFENEYRGHNIAAIAVNQKGEVIDFEFNHNRLFHSSVEHAESRLMRRLFSLRNVHHSWEEKSSTPKKYGNMLENYTIYTTLESCSQCSGIMTLGNVETVVYLQKDPGMYHIGNILKNLTDGQGYIEAPRPISGEDFDFEPYSMLNKLFQTYAEQQNSKVGSPFLLYKSGKKKYSSSITSFLATDGAFQCFKEGQTMLQKMELAHPDFQPAEEALTNAESLVEVTQFYQYCIEKGHRATPHRT